MTHDLAKTKVLKSYKKRNKIIRLRVLDDSQIANNDEKIKTVEIAEKEYQELLGYKKKNEKLENKLDRIALKLLDNYQFLYEESLAPIVNFNEKHILSCNQEFLDLIDEINFNEVIQKSFFDYIHKKNHPELKQILQQEHGVLTANLYTNEGKIKLIKININSSTYLNKSIFTASIKDFSHLELLKTKDSIIDSLKQGNNTGDRVLEIDYSIFTRQEIQIIDLIKTGKTSKQIAALLNLSVHTINSYRSDIKKKLGLNHSKNKIKTVLNFATSAEN